MTEKEFYSARTNTPVQTQGTVKIAQFKGRSVLLVTPHGDRFRLEGDTARMRHGEDVAVSGTIREKVVPMRNGTSVTPGPASVVRFIDIAEYKIAEPASAGDVANRAAPEK